MTLPYLQAWTPTLDLGLGVRLIPAVARAQPPACPGTERRPAQRRRPPGCGSGPAPAARVYRA